MKNFIVLICFNFIFLFSFAQNIEETYHVFPIQQVHSIEIPDTVHFSDENISLLRFDFRERFDRELLSFSYMHANMFLILKRTHIYFPLIEPILKENGVPDDFKYLALIESYFNPRALSPVKAAGIWQFMPATAEMYGLEVNEQVDERYHLEKATEAACKYLTDAYNKYGSWLTAAAAYNVGGGRLSRELEKQQVTHALDLYLNEETSRYIFRLLAIKELISHPEKYGYFLKEEHLYENITIKEVEIDSSIENWSDWAKEHQLNYATLKHFNLWIRDIKLDNPSMKTYKIKIPVL